MGSVETCIEQGMLVPDREGIVRVPQIVRGRAIGPDHGIARARVEEAFHRAAGDEGVPEVVTFDGHVAVREARLERDTRRPTGDSEILLLRSVSPLDLVERRPAGLARGVYALPQREVYACLERVGSRLAPGTAAFDVLAGATERTSATHPTFVRAALAGLPAAFAPSSLGLLVDRELSLAGIEGSRFLDGWVELEPDAAPGLSALLASGVFGTDWMEPEGRVPNRVRAVPTRQAHVTAGNSPLVPVMSWVRAILTKSYNVVKSPQGAIVAGALLGLALMDEGADHPIVASSSIVYWKGGDRAIEDVLFLPGHFDRLVVWGSPGAVEGLAGRSALTRMVFFNPRYGVSFIGREALGPGEIERTALRAAADSMVWNQKACIASLVHYVEGTEAEVNEYAGRLREVMDRWDEAIPNHVDDLAVGRLRRMKRGKLMSARWIGTERGFDPQRSQVVVTAGEVDLLDHTLSRLILVRRVERLEDALAYLHHGVSTVSIAPEERRAELRDAIAACGVDSIPPLGRADALYPGRPHDGMRVLCELVQWVSA